MEKTIDLPNVTAHGLITLYVLADSFIVGIPVRLLHFYQPPLLGIAYAIFSWIYWACGGTDPEGRHYVYSVLDYSASPKGAVACTLMLVLLSMFLHVCMFGLYKVRLLLCEAACCQVVCCLDNSEEHSTNAQDDCQVVSSLHLEEKDSLVNMVVVDVTETKEPTERSHLDMTVSNV